MKALKTLGTLLTVCFIYGCSPKTTMDVHRYGKIPEDQQERWTRPTCIETDDRGHCVRTNRIKVMPNPWN